ncbi:MAG: GNAT family N-acetyltransferase [Alistipes sp.]|nr:GNAT family N-acetyltransferase [Candidatus Alistipes equi]
MDDLKIVELVSFSEDIISSFSSLMKELNSNSMATKERLRRVIEHPSIHQYVVKDSQEIVACATLCVSYTPEKVIGFVEAVVVKESYRGRHLGRRLMERIISNSKDFGVQEIHLTSNPRRVAANGLYLSLGFEKYNTNCYHLKIE